MRVLIVALLCALSYAQTETAVGTNDGWYVHCTGAMLEIAQSKKFIGSNQALSSKMLTREDLAKLKKKKPKEAAKFPMLTFFIKLDAPDKKGRLEDAYSRIPNPGHRLSKKQISGCIVLTDPSNLVDDALEADGAGNLVHPYAYPKAEADEIPLTADGEPVGGAPSMKVEGYFADFTRCDKENTPDSEECQTVKTMMAAFSNAFTGKVGILKYGFTIFGQESGKSPEFAAACTKFITETFKGRVRGETSVAEDNFNTVLQNKNFHYFVVPATLILFFAIIWGVQNSKRSNSDYSQLLEQDEV